MRTENKKLTQTNEMWMQLSRHLHCSSLLPLKVEVKASKVSFGRGSTADNEYISPNIENHLICTISCNRLPKCTPVA